MRRFILPENANTDAISAVCQDGVLTVTVEKLPPKLTTEVEEEMLMRKFYDLMAAQGLSKKCCFLSVNKLRRSENEEGELVEAMSDTNVVALLVFLFNQRVKAVCSWSNFPPKEGSNNVSDGGRTGQSTASLPNTVDISDGGIDRHSSAIVPFTATDEQM
ncbi:hypothetical protein POTOM_032454 [Populus tomentosa]|uniref:SHSP domain-containing protein n=1 Tax=Populus tomentosa TaxID=118781 RepID=A0A8X8CPT0_POPTO|nr:hypothetical protein POTOM_032454 [Populus tomentosa]